MKKCGQKLQSGFYQKNNFKIKRLFHTYNHVSKNFTMAIFNFISDKWLKLNLGTNFYDDKPDMYSNSFTPLTEYDIIFHNYSWGEEIKSIL